MRRLFGALAFLTRIPIPGSLHPTDAAAVGRAMLFFPLVGALIGGGAALLGRGLTLFPPMVAAILVVAYGALVTGALHLDGLADSADGFGGGKTRDDVLRIMKDHAVGAFGATALVLLLALKMACVASLLADWRVLILAPLVARWASVPLCRLLPPARSDGLGQALGAHVGAVEIIGASVLALGGAWWLGGARGLGCVGVVALSSAFGGLVCVRRIGGITGDTLGANTELSEVLVYLVWLAWR